MKMPHEEILHMIFCHSSKCLGTLAELNSSRYPKKDPHLGRKSPKIPGKTDENAARRNFARDFLSFI